METTVPILLLASASYTVSGNSGGPTYVGSVDELSIGIGVSGITGTGATVTFYIDTLGLDGVWYQIWASSAITAVGNAFASLSANNSTSFGSNIRIRWTIGGTTPNVTFSASIIGKA